MGGTKDEKPLEDENEPHFAFIILPRIRAANGCNSTVRLGKRVQFTRRIAFDQVAQCRT